MKLTIDKRDHSRKSMIAKLRREGGIPAILYSEKGESVPIAIRKAEFDACMRAMRPGCLATQKFKIEMNGETFEVLIKDIAYHRTTYDVLHVDLMKVTDDKEVTVHVPVTLTAEDVCVGIGQGGQIKRIKRSVKVSCLVKDIPQSFELNVSNVALGESLRVSDLPLADSMKVRINNKQVLMTVGK